MSCPRGCCETYREHITSVSVPASATPSRNRGKPAKQSEPKNSWERGVPTDHRGMPYLDRTGEAMGVHEWASERSHFTESLLKETQTSKE